MIIDNNFFKDTHLFFKNVSKKFILPNIGKLNKRDVSDKPDFSKVTKFDLLVEKELVEYFNKFNFINIISEEHSSSLLKENSYLTIDPIDGTRNFINGINKVVIMISYIEHESSIFSIIYDPVEDLFYHTHNNTIYKNFIEIKNTKYENHIGYLGDHAKIYFKDFVSDAIERKRSRSIGYDVLEVVEGKRSFMTIYGSKIWDLFPAMSFLKILNFKTNLPNMNFDYAKLDEKIIFYAEL